MYLLETVVVLVSVILDFRHKKYATKQILKYCICCFYINLKITCEIIEMYI